MTVGGRFLQIVLLPLHCGAVHKKNTTEISILFTFLLQDSQRYAE